MAALCSLQIHAPYAKPGFFKNRWLRAKECSRIELPTASMLCKETLPSVPTQAPCSAGLSHQHCGPSPPLCTAVHQSHSSWCKPEG